jgi:predicted CxxxxCH...CXXCH cytochrome family protein
VNQNRRGGIVAPLIVVLAAAAACGPTSPAKPNSSERPGQAGVNFSVTVSRQVGGTVTSSDGRISCGTTTTRCGPELYNWSDVVTLTATADAGSMFGTWAGDCFGRGAKVGAGYVCVLDTTKTGADKYVVPVFGEPGRTQHANFSEARVHALEYFAWVSGKNADGTDADPFECSYCHGSTFGGLGIALSCNKCHADAGHPSWQTDCTFCHGSPPPAYPRGADGVKQQTGAHPQVSSDPASCFLCHAETVTEAGTIIPRASGGKHIDRTVQAVMHADGYSSPAIHGRDFFDFKAGTEGALNCERCHSTPTEPYGRNMGSVSCNACHAAAGWTGWQTNCSFCHGSTGAVAKGGYDVGLQPALSAPPDAIAERLGAGPAPARTGAHQAHAAGEQYSGGVACAACHAVPDGLDHISGRDVRAAVALKAPGQAGDPDPLGYDPATQTCSTSCHGAAPSPAWTATTIACDACHAVPPATDAHGGLDGVDLANCAGCHPDTITVVGGIGSIDRAGRKHVNGIVDVASGHADGFAAPAQHGVQYLNFVAGEAGASNCQSCHTASYSICNSCHARPASGAWASWRTNCTFCHGTRTPVFSLAADLGKTAPPHDVQQRLGAAPSATRVGKHPTHLAPTVQYQPVRCAACHPVPSDVNHISPSASRRAVVVMTPAAAFPGLSPEDRAFLPDPLGTYDPATNRCTTYCHGKPEWGALAAPGSNPRWSTASGTASCLSCHGQPPPTGRRMEPDDYCEPLFPAETCSIHEWHLNLNSANGWDQCDSCHNGFVHLDGKTDMGWLPGTSATFDRVNKTCTSMCHDSPTTPYSWQ